MELLSEFTWQDTVTVLSVVFGLITLIAYLDQRRSNKEQKKMLEFVNRHLDKDITNEQIEELKTQKDKISTDVKDKIPTLGRIAILQDQADFYNRGLISNYQELSKVNEKIVQLNSDNSLVEIEPAVKNYLLKEISPKYRFEGLKQKSRDRILALLAIIIAIGATFPFGLDFYVQFVFGFYLMFEVMKYLTLDTERKEDRDNLFKNAEGIFFLLGLGVIGLGVMVRYSRFDVNEGNFFDFEKVEIALIIIGILILISTSQIIKFVRNKINNEINEGSH